jgi:hypothetical protein
MAEIETICNFVRCSDLNYACFKNEVINCLGMPLIYFIFIYLILAISLLITLFLISSKRKNTNVRRLKNE